VFSELSKKLIVPLVNLVSCKMEKVVIDFTYGVNIFPWSLFIPKKNGICVGSSFSTCRTKTIRSISFRWFVLDVCLLG